MTACVAMPSRFCSDSQPAAHSHMPANHHNSVENAARDGAIVSALRHATSGSASR